MKVSVLCVLGLFLSIQCNASNLHNVVLSDTLLELNNVVHTEVVTLNLGIENSTGFPLEVIEVNNNRAKKVRLPWEGDALMQVGESQNLLILFKVPEGQFHQVIAVETNMGKKLVHIKGNAAAPVKVGSPPGARKWKSTYPDGKNFSLLEDTRKGGSPSDNMSKKKFRITYFYRNGEKQAIIERLGPNRFSKEEYFPNGKLLAKGEFSGTLERQLKEGEWKTYHANGQLASSGKFKYGLKKGYHQEWYSSGAERTKARYTTQRMSMNDRDNEAVVVKRQSIADWFEMFYPDGTKKYDFRKIKKGGIYFAWYPNGQLAHMRFDKKAGNADGNQINKQYCYDGTVILEKDEYRGTEKGQDIRQNNPSCYPYAGKTLLELCKPYLLPFEW